MSWSLLSGSPRVGEPVGASRGLSSDALVRRARVASVVAMVSLAWGLGGLVAFAFRGGPAAEAVALFGIVPSFAAAVVLLLASRGAGPALVRAAAAFATLGLVLAVGGHLLHARGAGLRPLFPPGFGDDPSAGGVLALLVALVVVPLVVAAWLRASVLSFDASGTAPRSPLSWARALSQRDLDSPARPAHAPLGALLLLGEAWLLPGSLLLDVVGTWVVRVVDGVKRRGRDRLHVDVAPDALAVALQEAGCDVEADGASLRVRVPGGGAVLARPVFLAFPRVEASRALDVTGAVEDVRRFRQLLEGPLCDRGAFSWSRVGRRIEARLDALLAESARASTTEERGLLLEEAERMERALSHRHLSGEERALVAWKLQRLRGGLAMRMLTEPPGARDETRVLAPAPALSPPLARVMDAGGLAAMRRAVFVPHWIVPVRTAWGEREVVVNALTGKPGAEDAPRLLDAMTRKGPSFALEMGRPSAFLQGPVPTAALLREMRGLGEAGPASLAAIETVYVPFVPGPDGYVNVVTGASAPDLGAVVPVAA